jgi:tRNA G18 (ribose-2'-O)-methylase SpoU
MLLAERWLAPLADLVAAVDATGAPVYTGSDAVLRQITGFHVHRGAIASMHRPVLPPVARLLPGARRLLVLEDIVDHTNVGAIFRSAAGIGADALLVTPRCADPLYRRSVRVSMGTVFQVPWTRLDRWPQDVALLRAHGFTVAALAPAAGGLTLDELAAVNPPRLALVLGTEGDGLGPATVAQSDVAVRIPMAAGVDSLNVAAAGAVALWALRPPPR